MTAQNAYWCSTTSLPCACGALPVDVILCVPTAITLSGLGFIDATLTGVVQKLPPCGSCALYNYTFSYDDALLVDPLTLITSAEISGVICRDCMTRWAEGLLPSCLSFGSEVFEGNSTISAGSLNIDETIESGTFTLSIENTSLCSNLSLSLGLFYFVELDTLGVDYQGTGEVNIMCEFQQDGGGYNPVFTTGAFMESMYSPNSLFSVKKSVEKSFTINLILAPQQILVLDTKMSLTFSNINGDLAPTAELAFSNFVCAAKGIGIIVPNNI